MAQMAALMKKFREDPPREIAGDKVTRVRDYLNLMESMPGQAGKPFKGPVGDMVMLETDREGTYVAVRPSGTEPKVKFYMFTYEPAEQLHNLETTKAELAERLKSLGRDLTEFSQVG
jgi:phosphoglucomutase/phosphomannomutase